MYLAEEPHHMTSKDWQLKHLSTGNAYEGMLAPSSYLHTASVIIFKLNWNLPLNYNSCTCTSQHLFGACLEYTNRSVLCTCVCGILSGKLTIPYSLLQTEEASSVNNTTIESSHTVYVKLNTWKVMLQESIVKSTSLILLRSQLKLAYEQQRGKKPSFLINHV